MEEFGVVVASDINLEWLLKWWYTNYRRYNNFPICFIDLGLSPSAHNWCKKQGICKKLEDPSITCSSNLDLEFEKWNLLDHGYKDKLKQCRNAWLKKPFAMQLSPFKKTLYLDLDCEVTSCLNELFKTPIRACEIGAALSPIESVNRNLEFGLFKQKHKQYNCGVLLYQSNCPAILTWQKELTKNADEYLGDEDAFCKLASKQLINVYELSREYNWQKIDGENSNAKILHWATNWGKTQILKQM